VTHTVTLISDHKGFAIPKALGDEYVALGSCNITAYRTGTTGTAASQTINTTHTARYTRDAGSYLTDGFVVGDHIVIVGSESANNAKVSVIDNISTDGLTITVVGGGLTNGSGGGDEQITHAGEKILASSFGLATLSSVELAGQENHDNNFIIGEISADGTFFYLYAYTTGSAALLSASLQSGDLGTVKLKVQGNL